jgi:hypothetical protein
MVAVARRVGHMSFYVSGSIPGFSSDQLALLMATQSENIRGITARRLAESGYLDDPATLSLKAGAFNAVSQNLFEHGYQMFSTKRPRQCRRATSPTTSSVAVRPFRRGRSCCCSTDQPTATSAGFLMASVLTSIAAADISASVRDFTSVWAPPWCGCRIAQQPASDERDTKGPSCRR